MAQTVGLLFGKEVHQPAQHQSGAYKRAKDLRAVNKPLAGRFFGQNPEHHGDQEGEYDEGGKVCQSSATRAASLCASHGRPRYLL